MENVLEEDDTGDGKNRSKLQKGKMDQHVAAEGETLLTKVKQRARTSTAIRGRMMSPIRMRGT